MTDDEYPLDWQWQPSHRGPVLRFLYAVKLFLGIVGRVNQADCRTGPLLAWQIARDVHRKCVCWGCCVYGDVPGSGWRRK